MELSPKQSAAISAVDEWFKYSEQQIFRLFGYAGTGKTTIANRFAEGIDGDVLYGAYTGKAAAVMRSKGIRANTIHGLTYRLVAEKNKKPVFELDKDSAIKRCSLLVLDEVSMVNEENGRDVCSFGKKILVLGDPMQLPPVQGTGYFTAQEPDFLLDEIHRQASDSPIIKLATEIRSGRMPLAGKYGDSTVQYGMSKDLVMGSDQLLVGKNATRVLSNVRARELKGFKDPLPMKDDKLVCLRNNRRDGVMNGTTWKVLEVNTEYFGDPDDFFPPAYTCDIVSDDDPDHIIQGIQMHKEPFLGQEIPDRVRKLANEFDYGYALTCHKAQGSQWNHVVVFDESEIFRENKWRWLYTAVTRAAEKVNICKR